MHITQKGTKRNEKDIKTTQYS